MSKDDNQKNEDELDKNNDVKPDVELLFKQIEELQNKNQILQDNLNNKDEVIERSERNIKVIQNKYEQLLSNELNKKNKEIEDLIKRYNNKISSTSKNSKFELIKEIRTILIDLFKVSRFKHHDQEIRNLILSIEMIFNSLMKILEDKSISIIWPNIGDEFDYKIHHAIASTNTDVLDKKNTISDVIKPGIKILDSDLFAPAEVTVLS